MIEKKILGGLLIDRNVSGDVMSVLTPDSFRDPLNRKIFAAMRELHGSNQPIDVVTVAHKLPDVPPTDITALTYEVTTATNTQRHALILAEDHLRRKVGELGELFADYANDRQSDIFDTINTLQTRTMELTQHIQSGNTKHISKYLAEVYGHALKVKENPHTLTGVASGFRDLDQLTNGWRKPDLIILAARPAMGKTAMMLNLAVNAEVPIGIFSLEMSGEQLTARILSMTSGVSTSDISRGKFSTLETSLGKVENLPIYINDKAGTNPTELYQQARRMVNEYGVKMIMVDYIQLMTDKKRTQSREQEVSQISRSLKLVAKELHIPVIALSQLSRSVESRSDKRPILSDLRESGAIEQDADMVLFLYRPEYYGIEEQDGDSTKGLTEMIISKHRNGPLGTIQLSFQAETTTFNRWHGSYF